MRYALIYGSISGAITVLVIASSLVFNLPNHAHSEIFGYLVMLAALSLIFVGVKRYRDVECGGVIRFVRAFLLGLGIAVVAGVIYTFGWELYLGLSGRDFIAEYSASVLKHMRESGAAQAAIDAQAAQLRALAASYRSPLFRLPMTFIEIFPVGLVVALISAAILRNPRVLPARR
jgi:small-conductance mechanosensitive channel